MKSWLSPALLRSRFTLASAALLAAACVTMPSPESRRAFADQQAQGRGWDSLVIPAGTFEMMSYVPAAFELNEYLTLYIEGDGLAWLNATQPSLDPTPREPVGLALALAHPRGNAAYVARPCQYVGADKLGCEARYWTRDRFAPEVITATCQAIDVLKKRSGATRLTLVGYSGGGAVAALVAARRNDVERLVTVAGNLDHRAWTVHHRVSPLSGSANPVDEAEKLQGIRQWHLVGEQDTIVPPTLVRGFSKRLSATGQETVKVFAGYDHRCCWPDNWPAIWSVIESLGKDGYRVERATSKDQH